jgi:EpsI family protein
VTLGLLALTAGYVLLHPPVNLAVGGGVLSRMPRSLGPWNGTELSFEDAVVEELKADDVLIRRYENGNDVTWLCIVFHQNNRYGGHDPRVCYQSQGYIIEREHEGPIGASGVPGARWFVAERPGHPRLVAYWWNTAGLTTADSWAFRRQMALTGALQNRSWGAFVRVETPIRDGDERAAELRLRDFGSRVAEVLPAVFATPPAEPAP